MISKKLFPLALGGLGIGTTEFVIMGLLPDVANSLGVSIPQAGYLISSYALGVVIGAPILVAFSSKYPPKKTLIALMILFTLFNGLSAIAPEYYTLLAFRFLSGLPHGAFFGVGAGGKSCDGSAGELHRTDGQLASGFWDCGGFRTAHGFIFKIMASSNGKPPQCGTSPRVRIFQNTQGVAYHRDCSDWFRRAFLLV